MRRCLGLMDVVEGEYSPTHIVCTCAEVSFDSSPNPAGQSPSVDLRCVWQDEQCTSCNAASGVCATNSVIGGIFYDDNENRLVGASSYTEFHYITGQNRKNNNTTIHFEYGSSAFDGNWCQFSIDGQLCGRCSYGKCNDNYDAHIIDCTNIIDIIILLDDDDDDNNDDETKKNKIMVTTTTTTYNGCETNGNNLGVFDAVYMYENKLNTTCSLEN
mmetsp:Transcript_59984/g.147470  ORF Transcript_59984/g.147470 Transcript_59984/m.147470 type:complete len:215 (-) Transcript_59984:294-938(-)